MFSAENFVFLVFICKKKSDIGKMSFIQFESARDKEKARQDLRDAREHMLEQAKKRAEQKAERDVKKSLKGENNWMLPSIEEKLTKKNQKLEKNKDNKKQSKKFKKKSHKRRCSSSENESETSKDESSSEDSHSSEPSKHKRSKKSRKSKKKKSHKKRKSSKYENGRESDDVDSSTDDMESSSASKHKGKNSKKHNKNNLKKEINDEHQLSSNLEEPLKRDSWMTESLMLKTFSKEREERKPKENQNIDAYDPAKSSRELNPYWKTTGTGLPSFKKPKDEASDFTYAKTKQSIFSQRAMGTKGWRKQLVEKLQPQIKKSQTTSDDETSNSDAETDQKFIDEPTTSASEFLTDQQMNELAAKILKAEILGNMKLADDLREKLEKARTQRNIFKERKKSEYNPNSHKTRDKESRQDEHLLLTHTDEFGNTRPLPSSVPIDTREMYGGKKKQKRVATHDDAGQRVRYFADDDRYDIKQMFEREKYRSTFDANMQFANMAGKHKNPNDDLEDIFAEKIAHDDTDRSGRKERNRAIREHQRIEKSLDNCDRCFESSKMQKDLLICIGDKVYLSLPWYQGLQPGHCLIVPTQHETCSTQIDEDTWSEINDFRKALTLMFAAQQKDVIFFEIANKLHRRPHLVVHCVPIPKSDGEMAPFYFKKAIEESEHDWSVNKQLISLRNRSLRNAIPKGLPYFWVNFGTDSGFAHVIEDDSRFPSNYAQEIIGGMLNLDPHKWRSQNKEQNIISKVKTFAEWWKKYDCTT